jgi:hypothetical protein
MLGMLWEHFRTLPAWLRERLSQGDGGLAYRASTWQDYLKMPMLML